MGHVYLSSHRWLFFLLVLLAATSARAQQPSSKPFILQLDNYRGQIQWEQSTNRQTWQPVPNGTGSKLRLTPTQTTLYRAKITEVGCAPMYSNVKAAFFDGRTMVSAKLAVGRVVLPAGATVAASSLSVMTFLEEKKLSAQGTFQVLLPDSVQEDVFLVTNAKEEVVMLGHYVSQQGGYLLTTETTADALLTMYPTLRPVAVADKPKYTQLYRKEPEYPQLVAQVTALAKQGLPLYSEQNTGLIKALSVLVKKPFNDTRNRPTLFDGLIIRNAFTSSVSIKNVADFSYTGRIYQKKDGKPLGEMFTIPGKAIVGSALTGHIVKLFSPPKVNVTRGEVVIDLKNTLNAQPGEYEIRARSGLADKSSPENDAARIHNMLEVLALTIANLSIPASAVDNECTKALVGVWAKETDSFALDDAIREKDLFGKYVAPILKELAKAPASCALNGAGKTASKLFGGIVIAETLVPLAWYTADWSVSSATIDGCQYLNPDYETSNCFVLEKTVTVKDRYFPGDTLEITVKAVDNKKYYPYTGERAAFRKFTWLKTGSSGFIEPGKPGQVELYPDRTLANGEATIKWVLSCEQEPNAVRTWVRGVDATLTTDVVATKTVVPPMEIFKTGDFQQGEKGKVLPKPIFFLVRDKSDNLPVKLSRFTIKWEKYTNGSWEEIQGTSVIKNTPNATPFNVSKYWTLENKEGEQKIRATLKDKCDNNWAVTGNPVVFTSDFDSTKIYEAAALGTWTVVREAEPNIPASAPYTFKLFAGGKGVYIMQDPGFEGEWPITWAITKTSEGYILKEGGWWHYAFNDDRFTKHTRLGYPVTGFKVLMRSPGSTEFDTVTQTYKKQ
ncbi:hypothetical protein GCM10027346_41970 [Hymenobacter seoulensis]